MMGHVMRKFDFCLCEKKRANQLCSNCTADQRLCLRYSDSTISLLPKIRNFKLLAIFYSCTGPFVSDLAGLMSGHILYTTLNWLTMSYCLNSAPVILLSFICLFVFRLNIPVNNFSVMWGRSQCFLGLTSTVGS